MGKTVYHVISHTHWDREWYEPFEEFRIKLVGMIDRLLDVLRQQPEYMFHLDAQTIVIDDYLEIRPERRAELLRYIRTKRILVGPWYIQNDFFLVSGESTVRNLLLGTRQARAAGHCDSVGYAPDQFGLPAQLPQVLRGFGIDNCVFARGLQVGSLHPETAEFRWISPDGSEVLAIFMPNWYNNAQRFSADANRAEAYLKSIDNALRPFSATAEFLLMNGVDHLDAQEDLLEIIEELNRRLPEDASIRQSSMAEYCRSVNASGVSLREHRGNLREGGDRTLLQGTLSSRTYLKILNVRAETALCRQLEPVCVMMNMLGFGNAASDSGFLHYLWKLLITNHPHDSICGCSADAVHVHMQDRYRRLFENIDSLLPARLNTIASRIENAPDGYYLVVFNTMPVYRSTLTEAILDFPVSETVRAFAITAPDGQFVDFELLEHSVTELGIRSAINLPGKILVDRYKIKFAVADLPPFGYRLYNVQKSEENKQVGRPIGFENELLKVVINPDGQIDLFDKMRENVYRDLFRLEDLGDDGDSYSFRPLPGDCPISSAQVVPSVKVVRDNSLESVCKIAFDWQLPSGLEPDTSVRSAETVANHVEILVRLDRFTPRLEFEVAIDNQSRNHLVRAVFNTAAASDSFLTDGPFDLQEWPNRYPEIYERLDREVNTSGLIWNGNEKRGGAIFTEGLHACEHLPEFTGKIAVTLLRATGYIYCYEEPTLDPAWIVPGNQCIGSLRCRLAFQPTGGRLEVTSLPTDAGEFLNPVLVEFGSSNPRKFSGGRPCVQDSTLAEIFHRADPHEMVNLCREDSLLALDNRKITLEAVKFAEDGSGDVVVRFCSRSVAPERCKVSLPRHANTVSRVRLDETVECEFPCKSFLELSFAPMEIITLKLNTEIKERAK